MSYRALPLVVATTLASLSATTDHLEALVITAGHDTRTIDITDEFVIYADEAELLPTEYEREPYDIGYGLKLGDRSLQLDYGYNDTGESGTQLLSMDIDSVKGDLYDLTCRVTELGEPALTATLLASDLLHGMNLYARLNYRF